MSYYCYCVFVCGVQHILCYIFHRLVFPLLPVSLDCLFLTVTSVFSDVYLIFIPTISLVTYTYCGGLYFVV